MTDPSSLVEGGKVEPLIKNGQYWIVPPEGGKPKPYTRVTTFVKATDDTTNLEKWKLRMAACGLVERPDLLALAASHVPDLGTPEGKRAMNSVCDDAMEAAKGKAGANTGTALHKLIERHALGEVGFPVLEHLRADFEAYLAATAGITWEHVELVVVNDHLGVAGRIDAIARMAGATTSVIADYKSGASAIEYGLLGISQQLAAYARATSVYDPATGTHSPMPEVDLSRGVVIHGVAGSGECSLYEVDLEFGWRAAQVAKEVRDLRNIAKRKSTVARPLAPPNLMALDVPVVPKEKSRLGRLKALEPNQPLASSSPVAAGSQDVAAVEPAPAPAENDDQATERITEVLRLTHDLCIAGFYDGPPAVAAMLGVEDLDDVAVETLVALREAHAAFATKPVTGLREEWLRARLRYLVEQHAAVVPAIREAWPEGCPTLKAGGLTDEQCDTVAAVLDRAESVTSGTWEVCVDPKIAQAALVARLAERERQAAEVPPVLPERPEQTIASDVLEAYVARLAALPGDLLLEVTATAKGSPDPIPNLRARPELVTQSHLDRLDALLAEPEVIAHQRRQTALALIDGMHAEERAVMAKVSAGVRDSVQRVSAADLERLRALAAAHVDGLVSFASGALRSTPRAAPVLLERHPDRTHAVAAAAGAWADLSEADRPRLPQGFDGLCQDPVLVAVAART